MSSHALIRFFANVMLGLAVVLHSADTIGAEDNAEAISLSLTDLTKAPGIYDGKTVVVSGYLAMGFERHTLCPAAPQSAGKDCVWLSGEAQERGFNGKQVTLRGTFGTRSTGHMGCCAGTLRVVGPPVLVPEHPAKRQH